MAKQIAKARKTGTNMPAAKGTLGKKGSTTVAAAKGKGTVKGCFKGSGDNATRIRRGVQY